MATRGSYEEAIRLYVETSGDKELGALAAQISKLGAGSDAAADQAQSLVAELDKLAATSNNIKQFTTLKAEIADTGAAMVVAKTKLAGLTEQLATTDKPTKALEKSLARATTEVEKLAKQQNTQQVALQRTSGALRAAGVDTDKLAGAYADLQGEFGEFSRKASTAADAMQRTAKEGKNAAAGVGTLDKSAKASSASLALISAKLLAVSGAAAAAIQGLAAISGAALFTGALRSAATLEDALGQVRAVSGATADEMVRLKEAAEQGGASTRFSSLEAAQGLGELARATGSAQAAIAALPATLNLAQAAGLGVADAAQIITTTLTQYGLAATEAGRVSDILAKAANSTTADVAGLGNALSYAAPLAKQLGLDVEQTTAIIGALADQGFRGERAGTALRNVFTEMQDPASDFAKALRDLGIESTDFNTVIEGLAKSGKRGQEALLTLDAAARPAILSLVNAGSTALRQLDTDLRNAAGSADATARIMGDTLPGAVESIKDTFDRARRSLVEPLLEPIRKELFDLSTELSDFSKTPEFEEIKVALQSMFVDGATAAREFIKEVDFTQLAADIKRLLGDAGGSITEFKDNIGGIVDAIVVVGNTFDLIFNTIQAAILGLAAVVTKLVSLMATLADGFTGPYQKVAEFFGLIDEGQGSLKNFAGGMGAVADEFRDRFTTNVREAADAAKDLAGATDETGTAAAAGLGKAADASEQLAGATKDLTTATTESATALAQQATAAEATAAQTAAAAAAMEAGADRLKKAFADLGIASQTDLGRSAESAKRNFKLIRDAVSEGEASAEDARRAFAKYAEAARAAVADSDAVTRSRIENELSVAKAGMQVVDTLDDMGDAGRAAGDGIASGAGKATAALSDIGSSSSSAAKGTEKLAEGLDDASAFMGAASKEGQLFALANYAVSESAAAAYVSLNKFAGSGRLWRDQVNGLTKAINDQGEALNAQIQKLQEANGEFDEMAGRRKELASQYDKLGAADIERLLQAEQQLEANRKQAADQQKRERDEAIKAAQAAQAAAPTGIASAAGTAEAAAAVSGLLERASSTANDLATAATKISTASASGEIVLRVVSDANAGAQPLTLTNAQLQQIATGVVRLLKQSKGLST